MFAYIITDYGNLMVFNTREDAVKFIEDYSLCGLVIACVNMKDINRIKDLIQKTKLQECNDSRECVTSVKKIKTEELGNDVKRRAFNISF
jgi:hypothetical protein